MPLPPSPTTTIAAAGGGLELPLIGLGTWQAAGEVAHRAVLDALELGYRLVDTATMYGNEREVGAAVRDSGLERGEVVVTTKLRQNQAGREREVVRESLRLTGLDVLDLWLVHWPPDGQARPDTWERFLEAREQGLVRAVGVSNYSVAQIDELIDATGVAPAVNQVRWGPALHDEGVLRAHAERGVVLQGYSPFKATDLDAAPIAAAARAHGVSTRQVVVRWHLQHGVVVIPKSTDRTRMAENLDVLGFELSGGELAAIDALGRA
ncbi:aldo/keto reductase [Kineococcus esterisolvens]|uniref:aldo/keto reductase n=1 Tax=unclassified Kineococcus TaxID=2621656 RepID=UPI003D7E1BBF